MINARAETVSEKPAYRSAFRTRRCWFEWQGTRGAKQPWYITLADNSDIHHRQPAIVHPDHFAAWLDPASRSEQLLDVVRKPCAGPFEKRPVSTRVNSAANNDADILPPVRPATS